MNMSCVRGMAAIAAAVVVSWMGPSLVRAQGTITCGQTLTGAIVPSGDADTWTLSATVGDAIVVRVGEINQAGGFTPRVRLYNPSSTLVLTGGGTAAAEVAVTAAATGTYTVVVDDGSIAGTGTATYRISLAHTGEAVTVSAGDEGGPLTNGAIHTGTIDVGDLDVWTVTANAGDAIIARMGETTPGSSLTPWLRIFSPTGLLMQSVSGVAVSEVAVTATGAGTYLVVAGDGSTGFAGNGGYRLNMAHTGEAVTVSAGDEGGPITNGAVHTGTIDVGDLDLWTVTAGAGDAIVVRMAETTPGSSLTPWLRIFSPTGSLVQSVSGVAVSEVAVTATGAGTYLVVAGDGSTGFAGNGGYRLNMAHTGEAVTVSAGDEGGPITNGAVHTGTIDVGDLDLWTVTAGAGDAIVVRMAEATPGSSLTPWLRIFSPAGSLVQGVSGVAVSEVAVTASSAGTYLVVAGDGSAGFAGNGGYRLNMAHTGDVVTVSPGDEGGPLTNGALQAGAIDVGDLDVWTLTASPGQAIVVRAGEITSGSTLTPWLRIFSPTGSLMQSNSGAAVAEVAVTASSAGTYMVVATDGSSGFAGAGGYRLTLAHPGDPITVSPGDQGGPLNGLKLQEFIDVGDLDLWTLTAATGNSIVVTMVELSNVNPLVPWLRIYGPTGALLQSISGAARAQLSLTAPATGTYLIVAADGSSGFGNSGGYYITPTNAVSVGDESRPLQFALSPSEPNPFATRTVLRYALPRPGPVSLRVLDAQGRVIRTLVDGDQAAGEYQAAWDGRDAAGGLARPGMYLARVESGGRRLVRKLMLAR